MDQNEVLDLHNIYGFAQLYVTLTRDGSPARTTSDLLYQCYCANISAYNNRYGESLVPLEPEIFLYKMVNTHSQPYRTNIQTIKSLTLLEWNIGDGEQYPEALQQICAVKSDYAQQFYSETGYTYSDPVTSFSVCEDTLYPDHEPLGELNPGALLRKHSIGPKLVYICAPLRGDVEKNIAFAKEKAREVFLENNIPICPHLMFPPIADPNNPIEDEKALAMCKALIDRCSEIRVYGPEWTSGMWEEINYASRYKIPILTDQAEVPRAKRVNSKCR